MNPSRRLAVTAALALPALAGLAEAACSRPVRVPISPMGRNMMTGADGSVGGAVPELLQAVAAHTGCRFDYIVVPRARAHLLFESGEADLLPGATRTAERDALGVFVHLYNSRATLVALAGRLPAELELAAISRRGLTLGAVRGYNYGPDYMRLVKEAGSLRLSLVPDPDTAARMLAAGRFDAVLIGPSVFAEAAQRAGLADRIAITEVGGMQPAQVGIYLQRQALPAADLNLLREAIAAPAARADYGRLLRQYYATPKWSVRGLDLPGKP